MTTQYSHSLLSRSIILFFSILLISVDTAYSTPENDSSLVEGISIDPEEVTDHSMGIDSASLRINDTTAASFSALDPYYCQDNVTVIPVTFTPPSPASAKRLFVRIDNTNGITSTGQQYNANFTPSVKGKLKINYIVQDSIFYDSIIYQFQPVTYQPKGGGPEVTNGCGCNVPVGSKKVYLNMSPEKVGYSSDEIVVSIGDFYLPSYKCVSDAPFDLATLVDPAFATGTTGTQFSIVAATSYNPAVLQGTMFDPGQVVATTTFTIQYDYVSPLGCSDAITRDITVATVPATPSFTTISLGKTNPCEFTAVNYKVNSVPDATSYDWDLPTGWTGSSSTNLISTHTSNNAGNVVARALNACGASADATLAVTPNTIPNVPGSITGAVAPCQSGNPGYSITAVPGATSYVWSMPADWTGSSTSNTLSATVGKAIGNITVSAVNACGTSTSASSLAVTTDSIPATPGAISGLNSLTQSTTSNPYSISAIGNATSYVWSYSGLGSTIHGSGANVTVDFSGSATSGSLSVKATNACGTSTFGVAYPITVSPSTVAQPGNFTTSTLLVCRGQNALVYTIPNDPTVTYVWAYSGTGATINGTTNSVTIDFSSSASSGLLSVTAVSGVTSSTPRAISLDVKSIPGTPDLITGSVIPYVGLTSVYNVTAVTEATSYTWALPASWTGTSTTNTISTIPGNTAGVVTVSASNHCGTSSVSTLTGVTPGVKPAIPGIISGAGVVLQGSSNIYSVSPVTGATSYIWTYSGAGATLNATGSSVTIDFSSIADSNGILRVVAVNAYGTSNTSSMNIEVTVVNAVKAVVTLAEEKLSVLAFPNPYMETAFVKINAPENTSITLIVTDLFGHTKSIVTDFQMQGYKEFELPDLESGVHILSLYAKGAVYITKVVRIK
jgi:hypothetical protein